jgi:hypothetical protein
MHVTTRCGAISAANIPEEWLAELRAKPQEAPQSSPEKKTEAVVEI